LGTLQLEFGYTADGRCKKPDLRVVGMPVLRHGQKRTFSKK
jgi:hypothetical protein